MGRASKKAGHRPVLLLSRNEAYTCLLRGALKQRIGRRAPDRVPELKQALGYALDWPELENHEADPCQ